MESIVSDLTFSPAELSFIRQCIDLSTISAKDAKFVAGLQSKIDTEVQQIAHLQKQAEEEKRKQLEEIKNAGRKKANTPA